MKLQSDPRLPQNPPAGYVQQLVTRLYDVLRPIAQQVNALSDGHITAHASYTAAPTSGSWNKGDFVRNSTPAEAGAALSKYVVTGWICTVAGTPGTWLECRSLTGN
jgi:hypothetical protein